MALLGPEAKEAPVAPRAKTAQRQVIDKKIKRVSHHRASQARSARVAKRRRGRSPWYTRVFTPLRGSRESLVRQNEKLQEIARIEDDVQLLSLVEQKELIRVPETGRIRVNDNIPEDRRYVRPWTKDFLVEFAEDYHSEFGASLIVTSAVRTREYQKKLRRKNGNAADLDGETASPHLTGATIDIGKKGMSRKQLQWMRDYLLKLQTDGLIDVAEEFRQSCFHITVYPDYESLAKQRTKLGGE